jgi:hypothetical protein
VARAPSAVAAVFGRVDKNARRQDGLTAAIIDLFDTSVAWVRNTHEQKSVQCAESRRTDEHAAFQARGLEGGIGTAAAHP